jgi:hypothetical protein
LGWGSAEIARGKQKRMKYIPGKNKINLFIRLDQTTENDVCYIENESE